MSKQTELVGLARTTNLDEVNAAYSAGALSNRNLIINGAMQVAQRGTSFTSSGYTVDRWRAVSDTAIVAQKVEDTVDGRKVSVLQSVAVSGHTYHAVLQRVEGMRRIQGQTLTLSAWVKGSAGVFTQYAEYRNAAGGVVSNSNFDFTFTGNWQKLEWTFTAPTNASYDSDAAWYSIAFYGGDSLSLTMVQLEVGDTATPFEHRSYGQELSLCQRYYWSETGSGDDLTTNYATLYNTSYSMCIVDLPVTMRVNPTVAAASFTSGILGNYHSRNRIQYYLNTASASVNNITADAEL